MNEYVKHSDNITPKKLPKGSDINKTEFSIPMISITESIPCLSSKNNRAELRARHFKLAKKLQESNAELYSQYQQKLIDYSNNKNPEGDIKKAIETFEKRVTVLEQHNNAQNLKKVIDKNKSDERNSNREKIEEKFSKLHVNVKSTSNDTNDSTIHNNQKESYQNAEEYIQNWIKKDKRTSYDGFSIREQFANQLVAKNYTAEEFEEEFRKRNEKRIANISNIFNQEFITTFVEDKGITDSLSFQEIDAYGDFLKKYGVHNIDSGRKEEILSRFSSYTQGEIMGELLQNINEVPNGLFLFQLLIASFAEGDYAFNLEHATGKWNEDTLIFLNNLLNDPTFTNEPRYQEYAATINKILEEHKDIDYKNKESKFKTLSEDQRILDEYWKDPEAFWKKQNIEGKREFVGITTAEILEGGGDYKAGEQNFINNNSQSLDSQISELFGLPTGKELSNNDKEVEEKRNRIWKLLPSEDLNRIYDEFSKNPEVKERFKKFLEKNNLPAIDLNDYSIKTAILSGNFEGSEYEEALKDCYNGIWSTFGNEIMGLTNQALQYLKTESGGTALNIRNEVLKHFLPGMSIRPERENNGIFYFRDENNLDTLYQFNPETGEVALHDNISNNTEGVVDLGGGDTTPLLSIKGYEGIIGSLQVGELLPHSKAKNFEELQQNLLNSIKSKITVDGVANIDVVNGKKIQLQNEKNICKNELVGDFKYLLGVESSRIIKEDGLNYTLFNTLANTFKHIDSTPSIDNHQLVTMRNFFYKVCDSLRDGVPIKVDANNGAQEDIDKNKDQQEKNESLGNWKAEFIKKFIDPRTKMFNINIMERLLTDPEFQTELNRGNFTGLLRIVDKGKELYDLEIQKAKDISSVYEHTKKELHEAYYDNMLYSNIEALENNELLA